MEWTDEGDLFEVVVRRNTSDIAVITFFNITNTGADAMVGVADTADKEALADLCRACALALENAEVWLPISEDDPGQLPF